MTRAQRVQKDQRAPLARRAAPKAAAHLAIFAAAAVAAGPASAEWLTPEHPLRPGMIVEAHHLSLRDGPTPPGAFDRVEDVVGRETRVTLFPGRPIRAGDLGAPTVVERNDVISVSVRIGALSLATEGRALGAGGLGERIQVMNLDSRQTFWAVITGPHQAEAR